MDLLLAFQRWINTAITADLSAFAVTRTWAGLIAVLPLGIVFGVAHALTPGHGKTVLATYLVGSRLAVLRGIAVAAMLSFTHVGSAVVLALAASPLVQKTLGGSRACAPAGRPQPGLAGGHRTLARVSRHPQAAPPASTPRGFDGRCCGGAHPVSLDSLHDVLCPK